VLDTVQIDLANEEIMTIRECIMRVLNEYSHAATEEFSEHPLANFIRNDFRDTIAASVGETERLVFKGSAGQGNWARGPWVGVFDRLVTTSAQSGYYPVYLFREDFTGVYLSLNQGMTEAKKLYRSDAKTALRARAANYRAVLGKLISEFPEVSIDLLPGTPSNDTAFYEAGNICAKYYPIGEVPNEAQLIADLAGMVHVYETLIQGDSGSGSIEAPEGDEPPEMDFEDASRFRLHKRIERNAGLAKKVKQLQGYTCKVCGTNFESRYGVIGHGFIEAHHLKPLASLKGKKVAMDPATDFAVLCANCHRMIHRSGCVDDVGRFAKEHYRG
jgi:5-methylcytosine-specific restriction protein A